MLRVLHIKSLPQRRICTPRRTQLYRSPIRWHGHQRRELGGIPTVLLPPVVFGGLVVALWTWKCMMMVLFQDKIIYMPGLPPNARRETIADYEKQCGDIQWREEHIRSLDGTRISLCVASVNEEAQRTVYVLYFQGGHLESSEWTALMGCNASSTPPRLPFLSPVLRMLRDRSLASGAAVGYVMVCCSYRGYWTSKGRPSEKGIALDAAGSSQWIRKDHLERGGKPGEDVPLVIWGQSIGAGVATNLAAQQQLFAENKLALKTLILETPFISVRAMLETLYPQKWLPYRHLWPFLRNHLNSEKALVAMKRRSDMAGVKSPKIVILEGGKDELVPKEHGQVLEKTCLDLGIEVTKKIVGNALHTEVMVKPEGRLAVVEAIEDISSKSIM